MLKAIWKVVEMSELCGREGTETVRVKKGEKNGNTQEKSNTMGGLERA